MIDAGYGSPEVIIVDSVGQQNALPIKLYPTGTGVWRCEYVPQNVGPINVNIFFANQVIPSSPYTVRVSPGNLIIYIIFAFNCKVMNLGRRFILENKIYWL